MFERDITLCNVPTEFLNSINKWDNVIHYNINGTDFFGMVTQATCTFTNGFDNECKLSFRTDFVPIDRLSEKVEYTFKTNVTTQYGRFPLDVEVLKIGR